VWGVGMGGPDLVAPLFDGCIAKSPVELLCYALLLSYHEVHGEEVLAFVCQCLKNNLCPYPSLHR